MSTAQRNESRHRVSALTEISAIPVVADSAARDVLIPDPEGGERVFNQSTGRIERYSAVLQAWVIDSAPAYRDSVFQNLPVVCGRPNNFTLNTSNLSDGVNTSGNYRYKHPIYTDATGIRFLFTNYYNGHNVGLNAITVKAGMEWPDVSAIGNGGQVGTIVPLTFYGNQSIVLAPGSFALSDPIPAKLTAGNFLYTHTYVSVASAGMKWPLDLYTLSSDWEGATKGAPAADLSNTSGIAQTTEAGYGPVVVLGTAQTRTPLVELMGDSIQYGSGDTTSNGMGFAQRALNTAKIPYVQMCKPGEKSGDVAVSSMVYPFTRYYASLASTHVIEQYSRNDWANAITLSAIQANKLAIWKVRVRAGAQCWTVTSIPGTTSTDAWATVGNQTTIAGESVRLALNAWIRDGSPIDATSLAAVAVGTVANAIRNGSPNHPLRGYFEVADTVESARNSGFWKAPSYTTDGTHPTATGHAAMAAVVDTTKFVF